MLGEACSSMDPALVCSSPAVNKLQQCKGVAAGSRYGMFQNEPIPTD